MPTSQQPSHAGPISSTACSYRFLLRCVVVVRRWSTPLPKPRVGMTHNPQYGGSRNPPAPRVPRGHLSVDVTIHRCIRVHHRQIWGAPLPTTHLRSLNGSTEHAAQTSSAHRFMPRMSCVVRGVCASRSVSVRLLGAFAGSRDDKMAIAVQAHRRLRVRRQINTSSSGKFVGLSKGPESLGCRRCPRASTARRHRCRCAGRYRLACRWRRRGDHPGAREVGPGQCSWSPFTRRSGTTGQPSGATHRDDGRHR